MLVRVAIVLLVALLVGRSSAQGNTCDPVGQRKDCGYFGIQQPECEGRGCCWSPRDNSPYCFYKNGFTPSGSCGHVINKLDCGHVGTTQNQCESSGCCWEPTKDSGVPWCYYKAEDMPTYTVGSVTTTTLGVKMSLVSNSTRASPYGDNISPLTIEISCQTAERLHVKIYDPNNKRWEVPTNFSSVPADPAKAPDSPLYSYQTAQKGEKFWLSVSRVSDGDTIFNTSLPGGSLQFADQYLELTTNLPDNHNIYGLGEHVTPNLKLNPRTYTMWNFDTATPPLLNLYGSHPFYLELKSSSGQANGVYLRNSNGMDVVLDTHSLTYRVIGGIFDFYFFLGPEPEAVIQQYQEVIGRPHMPPYWGLGFHQCRYGYPNVEALEDVVSKYASNKIPLDTMWTDIDYMDGYKDFTLDPNNFPSDKMNAFVSKLHQNGQHYVVIIDPGISNTNGYQPFTDGNQMGVFIKDGSGGTFIGKVWPGNTAFPDFFHPDAAMYWQKEIGGFLNLLPVDGLWIDMNEISNFCNGECSSGSKQWSSSGGFNPQTPPYSINNQGNKVALNQKTLDMTATHYGGVLEYNAHNLFGLTEAMATSNALENLTKKRSFVISRSTFPGSGKHTGHWTGDNHSTWEDMFYSILGMLNFQMFGVPLIGSDICGFIGDTNEELCSRWIQLGAFYPFSRDHNTKGASSQELYQWSSVAGISRTVLGIRYSILPYYYTLFYKTHRPVDTTNTPTATVTRPLFFEFQKDVNTYSIDRQFMIGSAIMISPVLTQGATSVSVYFPSGKWYNFVDHTVTSANGGETKSVPAPIDVIPHLCLSSNLSGFEVLDPSLIHVRGGYIIPMQQPELTTAATRQNSFSLLVALDDQQTATGDLFWDDGESLNITQYVFINFKATQGSLSTTPSGPGYSNLPALDQVTVLGVSGTPTKATLNGAAVSGFSFDSSQQILTLTGLNGVLSSTNTIQWM